ncbi:discoidin domain-containing protein [Lysobacter sp. K5869]|uniref:discoidin domain-containing protein n=1 Tax=Lysobacter sp. K5869 TaxID=2820808 RepID=UPI001C05F5F5|nr:discoidin domain-containing protein [Lysobacter sp. K5869]QWP76827.1 discoidin domain-containing protein [Lysobacter sp. K5869]QWP76839.1 discoidin domain-containing protein [Lysobacter sp. K5869]
MKRVAAAALMMFALSASASENFSLHRPVTGSPICKPGEEAIKAVDGRLSSKTEHKFCTLEKPAWLQVDLQARRQVREFVVKHAGAGGEAAAMNTRAYALSLSEDGKRWRRVVSVRDNRDSVRTHAIAPTWARYVRLDVSEPAQDPADPATRIYELEVR